MWSRISLRMKITIITAIALSLVTVSITWFSNYNVWRNFIVPLESLEDGRREFEIVFGVEVNEQANGAEMFLTPQDGVITMKLNTSLSNFQHYSIIVAVIFILFGTAGAYSISWQALKPIKSLAGKMEDIDANSLSVPIEHPKSNDEVSRLTQSFNNMLRKLSRSFESQRLFAQNAAHELKTPLTAIRANIEVLQLEDEPSAEEYKEVVGIVKDSTERLIELVEGLLHLNSAVDKSNWQSFSGREVFETIAEELGDDISQKGLNVSVSGDCRMKGDRTLLYRALLNLVHNAVRYNVDNGTVDITLSDGGIIIEDGGVGIPAENLPHVFEPFYCVDKSRSKKLGGHGLGMAIAKNIFDSHDIALRISSEPGRGTKIFLSK